MQKNYLDLNIHIAFKSMKLKNQTSCMSTVSTLWKGAIALCYFDHIHNEIINIFCLRKLTEEDFTAIEAAVKEFILNN